MTPSRRNAAAAVLIVAGLCAASAGSAPRAEPTAIPKPSRSYGSGKILKPEFEELVRQADLIVVGRVVQYGRIAHPGPAKNRPRSRRFTFWEDSFAVLEIGQVVKGKPAARKVKVAFHSDLEDDKTSYQAGKEYLAFLVRPNKYPDAYTTAYFHYGQYKINDQGKAERVGDPSEISKPTTVVIEKIRKVLAPPRKGR